MDSSEYDAYLGENLGDILTAALQIVATSRPADPIEQLGLHLRHLREKELNPDVQVNCCLCNAGSASARGNTKALASTGVMNSYQQLKIQLLVEDWRRFNIIDSWNDLTRKHGDILQWWHVATCLRSKVVPTVPAIQNRKAWKTVRVFVSSTFRDMFCEREWLVKRVFPALRTWCAQRRLFLVECDLRWGVPKDSSSRATLTACLNEIDRCRAENTMPYFVGLIGNRYGWVPTEDEFPHDLRRTYCWMPGMSVTATELFTGAIWDNNPNAMMMMRDDSFLNELKNLDIDRATLVKNVLPSYEESSEATRSALAVLKECIQNHLPREQVSRYSCNVEGLINDGSYRLNLRGLNDFGDRLLEFLKERISEQYASVSSETLSSFEIQRDQHEEFMTHKSSALFGRSTETAAIMDYIEQKHSRDETVLVVSGSAGTGKSALMAHLAHQCSKQPSLKTVFHFVGATPGSTTLNRMLMRLWFECLDLPEHQIPSDSEELKRSLDTLFRLVSKRIADENLSCMVLFLDAVNQLDDDGDNLDLLWLPRKLPHNVRVIVSTLEGKCLDALLTDDVRLVKVEPLTNTSRRQIVVEYFRNFNKTLSGDQLDAILARPDAGRPLWLALACEELRVFGTFELLDDKIASLSGDLFGLTGQILERVVADSPVGGDLMQAALSLIKVSRFGLVESELLELLVIEPTLPPNAKLPCIVKDHDTFLPGIDKLPMQTWAILYLELRQFLRPVGSSGDGRLDFYHRSISKVVNRMMLTSDETFLFWRRRLANYFDQQVSNYRRKAEELPYQLIALKDLDKLEEVLTDRRMFDQLYREDTKLELFRFCQELGGYRKAAEKFLAAFEKWTTDWINPQNAKVVPNEAESDSGHVKQRPIRQFVHRVIEYSSQVSDEKGAASHLVGESTEFPNYGDHDAAWSPVTNASSREHVTVEFEKAVYVTGIVIYETFHAGGVKRVSVQDEGDGEWHVVYEADVIRDIQRARRFRVNVREQVLKSNRVRVEIDQSVSNQSVQIDAIALIGFENYSGELIDQINKIKKQSVDGWCKQWVARVLDVSSDYGTPEWSAQQLVGGHTVYPKFGSSAQAWCSKRKGAQEFVEVEYEKAVYISKIAVYETTDPGAISSISARDESGQWQQIYAADRIVNLRVARRFCPEIKKPRFKSNALRIETDASVLKNDEELDAIAIFGYEDEFHDEDVDLTALFADEDSNEFTDTDEVLFIAAQIRENQPLLVAMKEEVFLDYLTAAVKLGWFLIDLGEYEIAEKHLRYIGNQCVAKFEDESKMDVDNARKYAEIYYALVTLSRAWYLMFPYGDDPVAQYAESVGNSCAKICYQLHRKLWPNDSIYFGEVVSVCSHFERDYRDEVIRLFEAKGYQRGLVELYAMKGEETSYEESAVTRRFHEESLRLAYSEFGKYHMKTARAHQLYGQTLWNRWMSVDEEHTDAIMNESFTHYYSEYQILEKLYGPSHVQTVRSQEDTACVLDKLERLDEAEEWRSNRILRNPPAPYAKFN